MTTTETSVMFVLPYLNPLNNLYYFFDHESYEESFVSRELQS